MRQFDLAEYRARSEAAAKARAEVRDVLRVPLDDFGYVGGVPIGSADIDAEATDDSGLLEARRSPRIRIIRSEPEAVAQDEGSERQDQEVAEMQVKAPDRFSKELHNRQDLPQSLCRWHRCAQVVVLSDAPHNRANLLAAVDVLVQTALPIWPHRDWVGMSVRELAIRVNVRTAAAADMLRFFERHGLLVELGSRGSTSFERARQWRLVNVGREPGVDESEESMDLAPMPKDLPCDGIGLEAALRDTKVGMGSTSLPGEGDCDDIGLDGHVPMSNIHIHIGRTIKSIYRDDHVCADIGSARTCREDITSRAKLLGYGIFTDARDGRPFITRNAVELLLLLDRHAVSLAEAAELLRLPRKRASQYAHELQQYGLIELDPVHKRYNVSVQNLRVALRDVSEALGIEDRARIRRKQLERESSQYLEFLSGRRPQGRLT